MEIRKFIEVDDLDLDGDSYDKIDTLCEIFMTYQVYVWIEDNVSESFDGEEEAAGAVDELLSSHGVEEIAEEILKRKLTNDEKLKLGLVAEDEETGERYILVEEDSRQMMLFDGMKPGKVRKVITDEREVA